MRGEGERGHGSCWGLSIASISGSNVLGVCVCMWHSEGVIWDYGSGLVWLGGILKGWGTLLNMDYHSI